MFRKHKEEPEIISCEICKCLMYKEDAYSVRQRNILDFCNIYYCRKCKPPYKKIDYSTTPPTHFSEIVVDKNGKPVGYVKKPVE